MTGTAISAVRDTWCWTFDGQRAIVFAAVMVVSVDVLLALIHVIVMVGWDAPNVLRIDMDGSYGEVYQYAKYFWLLLLLIVYARANRNWPMVAWIALIVYFLFDDALLLHEQAGLFYSSQEWSFGLGPISAQNVGELTVSALVGIALLVPLVIGYRKGDARTRWIYRVMIALIVVLLVFAVVVDAVHGLFIDMKLIDRVLGFAEDFGEMLALSALVIFATRINLSGGRPGFLDTEGIDQVIARPQPDPAAKTR